MVLGDASRVHGGSNSGGVASESGGDRGGVTGKAKQKLVANETKGKWSISSMMGNRLENLVTFGYLLPWTVLFVVAGESRETMPAPNN